jgi:hypothetical protein
MKRVDTLQKSTLMVETQHFKIRRELWIIN